LLKRANTMFSMSLSSLHTTAVELDIYGTV